MFESTTRRLFRPLFSACQTKIAHDALFLFYACGIVMIDVMGVSLNVYDTDLLSCCSSYRYQSTKHYVR